MIAYAIVAAVIVLGVFTWLLLKKRPARAAGPVEIQPNIHAEVKFVPVPKVEEMAKYEHESTHKILGAIGYLKLQNLNLASDAEIRQAELKAELRRGFRRLQRLQRREKREL